MTIEQALRGIELEEKLHELRTKGARALETEASRIGREALADISRRELRGARPADAARPEGRVNGSTFHRACAAVQGVSSFAFAVAGGLGAPGACFSWAALAAALVVVHVVRARQLDGRAEA